MLRLKTALVAIGALASCAHVTEGVVVSDLRPLNTLIVGPAQAAIDGDAERRVDIGEPPSEVLDLKEEALIRSTCRGGLSGSQSRASAAPIDFFARDIAHDYEKDLARQVAGYAASRNVSFYYPPQDGQLPIIAVRCLRFVRFLEQAGGVRRIILDFVAEISPARTMDYIRIRPRRLFVDLAGRLVQGEAIGIGFAIRGEAVWVDGTEGKGKVAFDVALAAVRAGNATPDGKLVAYFGSDVVSGDSNNRAWSNAPILPLPAFSRTNLNQPLFSDGVTLTLIAAEVGVTSQSLPTIRRVFKTSQRGTERALDAALNVLSMP